MSVNSLERSCFYCARDIKNRIFTIKNKLFCAFALALLPPLLLVTLAEYFTLENSIYFSYQQHGRTSLNQITENTLEEMLHTASNYIHFLSQDSNMVTAAYYASELGANADLKEVLPIFKNRLELSYIEIFNPEGELLQSTLDNRTAGQVFLEKHHHTNTHTHIKYDKNFKSFVIEATAAIKRKKDEIAFVQGGYFLNQDILHSLIDDMKNQHDKVLGLYDFESGHSAYSHQDISIDIAWIKQARKNILAQCGELKMDLNPCLKEQFIYNQETIHEAPYLLVAKLISFEKDSHADHQWMAIVAMNANRMIADVTQARNTTLVIVLIGFIGAMLLIAFVARTISRPIYALKDAVVHIGEGDLNTQVNITDKGELGLLARAFNEMTQRLSRTTVSKNYLDNVVSSITDLLIVLDADKKITRVSQACVDILHYDEDELTGQPFEKCFGSPAEYQTIMNALLNEGAVRNIETFYRTRQDTRIPVQITGTQLKNSNEQVIGNVLIARDISQQIAAQQALEKKAAELERSNAELDKFAYVASHDLKAPLRAIANLAQWIEEDLAEVMTDDVRQQMDLLLERVKRMEELINGILDYSRIGRTKVDIRRTNTQELIQDILDSMPIPDGFNVSTDNQAIMIETAKTRLSQVIANLVSNALKYCNREDGVIRITQQDLGDRIQFSVSDNGPGIDPRFHERIFEIFQTLEAKDKKQSTGIGLTLVKKIVEDQGGRIWVDSKVDQGATFIFTWLKRPAQNN